MAKKKPKQAWPEVEAEPQDAPEVLAIPEAQAGLPMKRLQKGSRQFMHDLYKLELARFKKNTSYRKFAPILSEAEHIHFYHSHNSNGKPLEYANFVGGHTHKIITSVDANGHATAICGPAVKLVSKTNRAGRTRKVYEEIKFIDSNQGGEDGDDKIIPDDHTHVVAYQHSEELSDKKLSAIHSKDKLQLGSMQRQSVRAD